MGYLLPGLGLSLLVLPPLLHAQLPNAILRLIPLISSTISLQWAIDEYQFLSSWTDLAQKQTDAQSGASGINCDHALAEWFRIWGKKATLILLTSFPTSVGFGIANVRSLDGTWMSLSTSRGLFTLGSVFALSHMLYGPKALGLLKRIREGGTQKTSVSSLRKWLAMHVLRSLTTDLWATVCFGAAAAIELGSARTRRL